jgi:hypothetical protein
MFGCLDIPLEVTPAVSLCEYNESMQTSMNHHRAREAQQAAASRDELTDRIASALPGVDK